MKIYITVALVSTLACGQAETAFNDPYVVGAAGSGNGVSTTTGSGGASGDTTTGGSAGTDVIVAGAGGSSTVGSSTVTGTAGSMGPTTTSSAGGGTGGSNDVDAGSSTAGTGGSDPVADSGFPFPSTCSCTHDIVYWKNNTDAWTNTLLVVGAQSYTQAEAMSLLDLALQSDASLILNQPLMAALLNNVGCDPSMTATVEAAQRWLTVNACSGGRLPFGFNDGSATLWQDAWKLAQLLDAWNVTNVCM